MDINLEKIVERMKIEASEDNLKEEDFCIMLEIVSQYGFKDIEIYKNINEFKKKVLKRIEKLDDRDKVRFYIYVYD